MANIFLEEEKILLKGLIETYIESENKKNIKEYCIENLKDYPELEDELLNITKNLSSKIENMDDEKFDESIKLLECLIDE